MDKPPRANIQKRIICIQVMLAALIFAMGAKSFDIQIFKADELSKKAVNGYSKELTITGQRGWILDRQMNKLATSIDAISVSACPRMIKTPKKTAGQLARILNINARALTRKLSTDNMFTWVARSVSPLQAEQIKKLGIPGIYFEEDYKRFYPQRELASQVLGFTDAEDKGLEGLEFKYNDLLAGKTIQMKVIRDGNGRVFDLNKARRAKLKGKSIVLTLDKKIQYLSERILEKAVTTNKADSGIALVMRPNTGELLAVAHYPRFNPNRFSDYTSYVFRNRAATDSFEPGSAMKVFTAAAALEKGFGPKQIFNCEQGAYRIGSYTVNDTHPNSWLSINQIIKFSSNIGAVKIGETIGDKALYDYLTGFGFGSKTGVGCSYETKGVLMPYRQWSRIDAGAISFGQGISVSAIQLITGISALANGGTLMKPMLMKKIISDNEGENQTFYPQTVRKVVTAKTAGQVKHMMSLAVSEEGTGTKAAMDGYTVCGKTGTAQKAREGGRGYSKNKYISVFAGFAPKDNPELAVVVVVDEPRKKYYGGDVAAPAFKSIMTESFIYLNIQPEKNSTMIAIATNGGKQ